MPCTNQSTPSLMSVDMYRRGMCTNSPNQRTTSILYMFQRHSLDHKWRTPRIRFVRVWVIFALEEYTIGTRGGRGDNERVIWYVSRFDMCSVPTENETLARSQTQSATQTNKNAHFCSSAIGMSLGRLLSPPLLLHDALNPPLPLSRIRVDQDETHSWRLTKRVKGSITLPGDRI